MAYKRGDKMRCYKHIFSYVSLFFITPAFAVDVSDFNSFYSAYKTGTDNNINITSDITANRLIGGSSMSNINVSASDVDINGDGFSGFNVGSGEELSFLSAGSFSINNGWVTIDKSVNDFYQSLRGGVIFNYGNVNISNSAFTNNRAGRGGGVVQQTSGSIVNISNSAFSNNNSPYGAGGVINGESGSTTNITGSYFQENMASRYGGAISSSGDINIESSLFNGNTSDSGGAVYSMGQASINNSYFTNNEGTGDVGAVYSSGSLDISSSLFYNNSGVTGGALGVFSIPGEGYTVIKDSVFAFNKAAYGGAIFSWGDLAIIDTSFVNNTAEDSGGAISNSDGLNIIASNQNVYFTGNTAAGESNAILSSGGTVKLNAEEGKSITFNDKITGSGTMLINQQYNFNGQDIGGAGSIVLANDMSDFSGDVTIGGGTVEVVNEGKFFDAGNLQVDSGTLNLGTSQASVGTASFGASSQLSLEVQAPDNFGALIANNIIADDGAVLNIVLDNGLLEDEDSLQIQLIHSDTDISGGFTIAINDNLYDFSQLTDGWYEIKPKKDIKEDIEEEGGTEDNQDTADAWQDAPAFSSNELTYQVYERLNYLYQNDMDAYLNALTALAPTNAPIMQALSLSYMDNFSRMISEDISDKSGYAVGNLKLWAYSSGHSGYIGKNRKYGEMDAYGFNLGVGAEYDLADWDIGLAYMYQYDNVKSWARVIHAPTNGGGIYAKYNNNGFEWKTSASWFASLLQETKDVGGIAIYSDTELYTYGIESGVGYDIVHKGITLTPKIGARYYQVHRSSSADDVGQVLAGDDLNSLSSFANLTIKKSFYLTEDFSIVPAVEFGGSYDWLEDSVNNVVNITKYNYNIVSDALSKWQMNASISIKANIYQKLQMQVGADFIYRDNYKDISGNIRAAYKF